MNILSNKQAIRSISALALPLILTNFAYVALTTIDVIVLGRLGTVELAAGGLAIALFNQLKTTATGLITGLSNLVAATEPLYSTKNSEIIPNNRHYTLLSAGLFWAVTLSALSVVILLLLEQPLHWFKQQPMVIALTMDFLVVLAPAMLPALLVQVFRQFTTGLKHPGPLLLMTLLSVAISMVSNYVLVFGHWGLQAMGLKGVAVSSAVTLSFSLTIFYYFLHKDKQIAPYLDITKLRFDIGTIKEIFKLGLPIAMTYAAEAGFFNVLLLIVGSLSVQAQATQTIINQILYIVLMIPAGFSHAASVYISGAFSKKQWNEISNYGNSAVLLTLIICILIGFIYWLIPIQVLKLFTVGSPTDSLMQLMVHGLMFASILQLFDGMQNIGTGLLRGLDDTVTPMRYSIIGYWFVGLPIAWLLAIPLSFGIYGVWLGLSLGLAATSVVLIIAFHKRIKKLST